MPGGDCERARRGLSLDKAAIEGRQAARQRVDVAQYLVADVLAHLARVFVTLAVHGHATALWRRRGGRSLREKTGKKSLAGS